MKEEIVAWLKSGCNLGKGVALYLQYGDNARFKKMLRLDPGKNFLKLKLLLCRLAGLEETNYSGVDPGDGTGSVPGDVFFFVRSGLPERAQNIGGR